MRLIQKEGVWSLPDTQLEKIVKEIQYYLREKLEKLEVEILKLPVVKVETRNHSLEVKYSPDTEKIEVCLSLKGRGAAYAAEQSFYYTPWVKVDKLPDIMEAVVERLEEVTFEQLVEKIQKKMRTKILHFGKHRDVTEEENRRMEWTLQSLFDIFYSHGAQKYDSHWTLVIEPTKYELRFWSEKVQGLQTNETATIFRRQLYAGRSITEIQRELFPSHSPPVNNT